MRILLLCLLLCSCGTPETPKYPDTLAYPCAEGQKATQEGKTYECIGGEWWENVENGQLRLDSHGN